MRRRGAVMPADPPARLRAALPTRHARLSNAYLGARSSPCRSGLPEGDRQARARDEYLARRREGAVGVRLGRGLPASFGMGNLPTEHSGESSVPDGPTRPSEPGKLSAPEDSQAVPSDSGPEKRDAGDARKEGAAEGVAAAADGAPRQLRFTRRRLLVLGGAAAAGVAATIAGVRGWSSSGGSSGGGAAGRRLCRERHRRLSRAQRRVSSGRAARRLGPQGGRAGRAAAHHRPRDVVRPAAAQRDQRLPLRRRAGRSTT